MPGEPSFIELGVPDPERARTFYGGLLGWTFAGPGRAQTETLSIGLHGGDDASLFEVFFAVPDLEAALRRVAELGGLVVGDIHDNADFGRWAECDDDQGVRFGLREVSP